MPEPTTPLLVGPPPRNSNKKALKVAGLTLLACLLLAGQAITAYMVVGQRGQLRDLDMRMHRLKEISSKSAVGQGAPMRMRLPMSSMPLLKLREDPADKKDSGTEAPKDETSSLTQCQKEARGMADTKLPSFRPQCDRVGGYLPQQCWESVCWCVDANGKEIPNTVGNPSCANGNMRFPQAFASSGLLLQPKMEVAESN